MIIFCCDFLNGVVLIIVVGLIFVEIFCVVFGGCYYLFVFIGLCGSYLGVFEVVYQMGWEKKIFDVDYLLIEEEYDLVVVGGGISGFVVVWFYCEWYFVVCILVIENYDDFGGYVKCNEFQVGGCIIFGYGGSELL